jgi:hypothetical protein
VSFFRSIAAILSLIGVCQAVEPPAESAGSIERFWSFQPVLDVSPRAVRDATWPKGAIDQFILAKIEDHGLTPSPPADKRAWLRRATFDLTGLPPTPEEIEEFLDDASPAAFAKVVECLLASPRYGERWGRHWLDVVRYADARDLIQLPVESDFREAWRYRDWVVDAFNRDLPYDEFVTRQLAGDLLQPADPDRIDKEAIIATGMLAIADFVPGDVDKEQMIADYVNDQIDVTGRALLGLTLACARCHDHKFDPITTEDYYALAGIFFSTRLVPGPVEGNTPLVRVPLLSRAELQWLDDDKRRMAELSQEIPLLAEREFAADRQRRLSQETPSYLLAIWDWMHPELGRDRPSLADLAAAHELDLATLKSWLEYNQKHPHPALRPLVLAADRDDCRRLADELTRELADINARRRALVAEKSTAGKWQETEFLRFRADDRRIWTEDTGQIVLWPDRASPGEYASPAENVPAPRLRSVMVTGHARTLAQFTGQELLEAPRSVPPAGSMFIVFHSSQADGADRRLVGWEDSSVGQHGLGLIAAGNGKLHAVLRRNGANGDVAASTPPASSTPGSTTQPGDFAIVTITWGANGCTLHLNGALLGSNKTIDSVSSDPAIALLRIGGPGSGGAGRFAGDLAELRVYASQLDEMARGMVEDEMRARWFGPPKSAEGVDDRGRQIEELYDELLSRQGPYGVVPTDRAGRLQAGVQQRLAAMQAELDRLKQRIAAELPKAIAVAEGGPPGTKHEGFRDAQVYLRGDPHSPGPTVPRGFPKIFFPNGQPPIFEGSGRRELARWICQKDHPLTARVMVNRIWQHHFGEGLVRTSTNFGLLGEPPSHPELLDYLAARFIDSGGSVKAMHRLIMLSSVYRQGSLAPDHVLAADPENRMLARMNRRRLEAEAIRDSLLAVAGRLDAAPGGPGFLDVSVPRRTLYLMSVRTGAKAAVFGSLFDAPDCGAIVERRGLSTVAPQALFLMNDPFVIELAGALARRVVSEAPGVGDVERIGRLYQIALGRPATGAEIEVGLQLLADQGTQDAWARYCHVVLCTNEFVYVD